MDNEKRKVICIVVGINETKILKWLNKTNDAKSFTEIFEANKDNPSLAYESSLGALMYRLRRKNLVNYTEINGESFYKINEKGKLYLEIIRKVN